MNLDFANRIGLAAGLDKNGDYIDALAALGFGFIEIGTVTPKPQSGNAKPRLFRLAPQEALINRMGFNSKGVEYVVRKLEKTAYCGVLGINIGKNKDTALENAVDDYLFGFRAFWKFASYLVINLSSPNTPGLRTLQQSDFLIHLLQRLKQEQHAIFLHQKKYVPLVVKISPDLSADELQSVAAVFLAEKIDGVIAANTTISRPDAVTNAAYAKEDGGLSGRPLCARSTHTIAQLHALLQNQIPIIASGGIMDEATAREKYQAGAALLQIYSGLIYAGPGLVRRLAKL
jgi:dihydroorotate dehydrogenase